MPNAVQEFFFAVEMILVNWVGDLVLDAIDFDKVFLQTFEHHGSEHELLVLCPIKLAKLESNWDKYVTYA